MAVEVYRQKFAGTRTSLLDVRAAFFSGQVCIILSGILELKRVSSWRMILPDFDSLAGAGTG
jgi:hypothetical protein